MSLAGLRKRQFLARVNALEPPLWRESDQIFAIRWIQPVSYTHLNGVSLFLDARNLFDERYVSNFGAITDARIVSQAVFFPGEGRSVFGLSLIHI